MRLQRNEYIYGPKDLPRLGRATATRPLNHREGGQQIVGIKTRLPPPFGNFGVIMDLGLDETVSSRTANPARRFRGVC